MMEESQARTPEDIWKREADASRRVPSHQGQRSKCLPMSALLVPQTTRQVQHATLTCPLHCSPARASTFLSACLWTHPPASQPETWPSSTYSCCRPTLTTTLCSASSQRRHYLHLPWHNLQRFCSQTDTMLWVQLNKQEKIIHQVYCILDRKERSGVECAISAGYF